MGETQRPGVVKWARTFWDRTKDAFYIGGVAAGIIVGVLKWYKENYPPTEPATSQELEERFDALDRRISEVNGRLTVYQDSLGRLYTFVDTAIAKPSLNMLSWSLKRLDRLEAITTETRMDNIELKDQVSRSTVALVDEMQRSSSAEERAKQDAEARMDARMERLENMVEAIAKKNKVTKIGM